MRRLRGRGDCEDGVELWGGAAWVVKVARVRAWQGCGLRGRGITRKGGVGWREELWGWGGDGEVGCGFWLGWGHNFCRRAALFGLVGSGVNQSKKPFQTRPARVTIVTTPLPSRKKTQMEQGNDERIASSCVTPGVCSNGNNRGKSVDNFSALALESEQSRFEISAVSPAKATQKPADIALFIRPENEDDDGYDPYSDRPATTEFFEPNPWD